MQTIDATFDAIDFAHLIAHLTGCEISTGMCCCCAEPRPMARFGGDRDEYGHVAIGGEFDYAEHRHVHLDSSSQDCDGRYDRTRVYRIPSIRDEALRPLHLRHQPDEAPTFHDLWTYLVRHEPPLYRAGTTVTTDEGRAEWSSVTDEGGEGGAIYVCEDVWCAHEDSTFRDHTAIAAGY